MHLRARDDERGAVLIIVAFVLSVLLTLSAGGIMLFTLYGSQREMQKAADQAALAGAAALPLLRPGVALSTLNLQTAYDLTDDVGLDVPIKGLVNVPDPRAVACAYGTKSLQGNSASLVNKFGSPPNPPASSYCSAGPWNDGRVNPSLNSLSTPLSACISGLTSGINGVITQLNSGLGTLLGNPLVGILLAPLGLNTSTLTANVTETIAQLRGLLDSVKNLEALAPGLLTPEMTVTVKSGVKPPMLSFITGGDGVQMTALGTAERRLKNAVVLPNTPALTEASLNSALAATRPVVMDALSAANTQLNTLMAAAPGGLGLSSCQNLLDPSDKVVKDIGDIYNPPAGGPAPSGQDLLNGALASAQRAASEAGTTVPALAGEAFLVITQGPSPSTLNTLVGGAANLLGLSSTLANLQIPAVDVAIVAAHDLEDGNLTKGDCDPTTPTPDGNFICDAAAARGLFTATLVK